MLFRSSLIARAVGWSFVVQIGGTLAVALVARTVRVDPGLGAWFAVAPLVALIETVPISIGGFGVRENASGRSDTDFNPAQAEFANLMRKCRASLPAAAM